MSARDADDTLNDLDDNDGDDEEEEEDEEDGDDDGNGEEDLDGLDEALAAAGAGSASGFVRRTGEAGATCAATPASASLREHLALALVPASRLSACSCVVAGGKTDDSLQASPAAEAFSRAFIMFCSDVSCTTVLLIF